MSNKKTIKAVPDDQKTKPKSETELGLAEGAVKKVKTTNIADFRRALSIGRSNLDKYNKTGGKYSMVIKIMGANGVESKHNIEYQAKLFTVGDWGKYSDMQWKEESGKKVTAMSQYAAALIVGCLDESGSRIFSPKDAEILDLPANAMTVMDVAGTILTASGASGDQDAVEKPD